VVVPAVSDRDPFKVDLRGIVDVLSNYLYSTPTVFVRELLQNALDAITARRVAEPSHAGDISIRLVGESRGATLSFEDDGIGLDEADVHVFLSTIGQSSKRDSPADFLGQFGIGILSCFVVSDEVTLVTRKVGSPKSFRWIGHSDGTYELASLEATAPIGTAVYLRPKADSAQLFNAGKILDTARYYGDLLPVKVTFTHEGRRDEFGGGPLPWQGVNLASDSGQAQMLAYGESLFGSGMMAAIPITSAAAGATGVAFLLAEPRSVHVPQDHRAYLRRMLVSDSLPGLTPDWAYFVRCVVNVNDLRPTAGRESFYEDEKLAQFQEEVGQIVRAWLEETGRRDPDLMAQFIRIHYMALKALATQDSEFYELFVRWLPFEGTRGMMPLGDYIDSGRELHYVSDHDAYRQLAGVARALGIELIDGGFSYDSQLLSMAGQLIEREIPPLDDNFLIQRLADPTAQESEVAGDFMADAQRVLGSFRVQPILKRFDPLTVPALLSQSDSVAYGRQLRASREVALPLFVDVLDAVSPPEAESLPLLVFNVRNELVRTMCGHSGQKRDLAIQLLYLQALMLAHQPLSTSELELLQTATLELLMHDLGPSRPAGTVIAP
jgi:molecular chaperone HtpG